MANPNKDKNTFFCLADGQGNVTAHPFELRDGAQNPPNNSLLKVVEASSAEEAKQKASDLLNK